MVGAQLEPAAAFFRRAAVLMIDRLGLFLKVGAIACAPMLVLSVAVAVWQLSHNRLGLSALGARGTGIVLTSLFILSLFAQSALGVIPIVVLRTVAEPLRPLAIGPVWRAYGPRIRRWVGAMLPFMLSMAALVLSLIALAVAAGWLRPWMQQLPRPLRTGVGLSLLLTPFVVAYAAMRWNRITFRNLGLFGAAMLVEDLPFHAAIERAAVLVKEAGGLRNAVQSWFTIAIGVQGGLIGVYIGLRGGRGAAEWFPVMLPVITAAFMVLFTVNGVVTALIYLSARRARGESIQQILEEDERMNRMP